MKPKSFCIVGFGNHSQSKIIPAINKIKGKIEGIVSKNNLNNQYIFYKSLSEAFLNVKVDTIFILCTPPDLHYTQAKDIINHGYNLFIEKPIMINLEELEEIIELSKYKNTYFVENFMHEYSKFYINFIEFWNLEKENIKKIDVNFTLPKYPENTFRQKVNNYPINLFDIGCYSIALINNLSKDAKFTISKVFNKGYINNEKIIVKSNINQIEIELTFGIDHSYKNSVKITKINEIQNLYEPFFFGREGKRSIQEINGKNVIHKTFYEKDNFTILFNKTDDYWFDTQQNRNSIMLNNLSKLEKLAKQYIDI